MASGEPAENLTKNKHLYLFEVLVKSVDIKEKLLVESEKETIIKNPLKVRIMFSDFYDVEINEVKDIKSIHLPQPEQVKCHSKMTKMFSSNDISKGKDNKLNLSKNDNDEHIDFIRKSSEHSRRAGFSCLFPMNPVELIQKLKTSYLYLMVYGNLGVDSEGVELQKIIGQAKVAIRSNFIDSVQYALGIDEFPTTASLATTCNVRNSFEERTGKIEIYVRLSCFGKFIISIFNMMKNNPPPNLDNNTQPTPKIGDKLNKKVSKQKKLNTTESSQSIKTQVTSSKSSKTLNAPPPVIKNQITSPQPIINQTATMNPTSPTQSSKNLNVSPLLIQNKITTPQRMVVTQSAPSHPTSYQTASSQPTANHTATIYKTVNQTAPSRTSKNQSVPSHPANCQTATSQPIRCQTATPTPYPTKLQAATTQQIRSQTATPLPKLQTASSRPRKSQMVSAESSKYQLVSPKSSQSLIASMESTKNKILSSKA